MTERVPPPLFGRRRLKVAGISALLWAVMIGATSQAPFLVVLCRTAIAALCALLAFGLLERFPRRLPRWTARWALQVLGVALVMPLGAALAYWATTLGDPTPFWQQPLRMTGFRHITFSGILIGPWIAMAALLRQRDEAVRSQAAAFERERLAYERRMSEARQRLLRAQVEPHFLFNTLANIRELVEAASPQAPRVLDSLIAYLRAAVPRLDAPGTTLGQEIELVRAYLEVMHMRMPDRLSFDIQVEPGAQDRRCPPMTLLTLVENAVRHGIDPSEEGGRIEVRATVRDGRCRILVLDTGVGLAGGPGGTGLGTGLATLRERLSLAFDGDATLRLEPGAAGGARAEVDFPAERVDA
ncbi:MAG TPA: histidine kinase [Azospirillaceae bacterium]|nr:histidine kinase [Azospirillaceae bacterium]